MVVGSGRSESSALTGTAGLRNRVRSGPSRRSTIYGGEEGGGCDFVCSVIDEINGGVCSGDKAVAGAGNVEGDIGRSMSWVSELVLPSVGYPSYAIVVSSSWRKIMVKSRVMSCIFDGV